MAVQFHIIQHTKGLLILAHTTLIGPLEVGPLPELERFIITGHDHEVGLDAAIVCLGVPVQGSASPFVMFYVRVPL